MSDKEKASVVKFTQPEAPYHPIAILNEEVGRLSKQLEESQAENDRLIKSLETRVEVMSQLIQSMQMQIQRQNELNKVIGNDIGDLNDLSERVEALEGGEQCKCGDYHPHRDTTVGAIIASMMPMDACVNCLKEPDFTKLDEAVAKMKEEGKR